MATRGYGMAILSGQAQIMLSFGVIFFQRIQYGFEMLGITQEVGIGGINKNGLQVVLPDIVRIGFLDAEEVIVRDFLFVGPVAFPDVLLELVYRRMKIDEQFRLYQLLVNDLKKALVEPEFILGKVDLSK